MKVQNNIRGITLYKFIGRSLYLILPIALFFRNNIILFLIITVIAFYLIASWSIKYYEINSTGVVIKYIFRFGKNTRLFNFEAMQRVAFVYENGTFAEPRLILESNNLRETIVIFNFRKVKNILERLRNHGVPILFQTTEYIIKKKIKWQYDSK